MQALAVAGRLSDERIDAIYSSDLNRACETAKAIAAAHGLPVMADARFRECSFGEWEGKTVAEVKEMCPDLYEEYRSDSIRYRPPGGERLEELQARVVEAINGIAASRGDDTIALVTHGGPIKALICHVLGADLRAFRRLAPGNCGITIVALSSSGSWYLDMLNDTCHLDGVRESEAGDSAENPG